MRRSVLFLLICFGFSQLALAKAPLMINIDNPNFRKLVAATPTFYVSQRSTNPQAKEFARIGSQELGRLLQFSGIFNVMNEGGYREVAADMNRLMLQEDAKRSIARTMPNTTQGVDIQAWKALGVESVTVAKVEDGAGGLTLEIRTIDITRNELLLAKRYTKVGKNDYIRLMRRYANLIMEIYTGRPGIFASKIVFIGRKTKSANKQVFLADFDGSNVVQLTNAASPHVSPKFSPDGRFVSFTSFRDGNPDLFVYELASGKLRKLTGQKGLNSGAHWAPNGKLIAFSGSQAGDTDIYTITPAGTQRKLLLKGSGLDVDPKFSPNGKWLAFVSGRYGNPHIFLTTLEWVGDGVRITSDKRLTYAGWYNATPDFAPDSSKIAFGGYDKDIDRWDIFMMNPDGTQLERLTLKKGDNENPSWSPNGQLIVYQSNRIGDSDSKGVAQLWMMNKDGSGQMKINTGLYEAQTPAWSGPLYKSEL